LNEAFAVQVLACLAALAALILWNHALNRATAHISHNDA